MMIKIITIKTSEICQKHDANLSQYKTAWDQLHNRSVE